MKFLTDKYYWILFIILLYGLLNVTIRDRLVDWYYNTPSDKSVTNSDDYAKATALTNIFSEILVALLLFIGVWSLILLITPQGKKINKIVLVAVILFVTFVLFAGTVVGGGVWLSAVTLI